MNGILKFIFCSLLLASSAVFADTQLNLTQGVSPVSHDIYELHMTIFWICVGIGVVVFGVMLYSIVNHRKSLGVKPSEFHENLWLEILWSIIPLVILAVMAIPATKVLLNMYNTENEDLTIKVTGYQWKWHYEYLEDNISFYSNLSTPYNQMFQNAPKDEHYLREVDHPVVVPIHKKIRFLVTSNDVTHSWWVPDIGIKRDAVPGYINESWARIEKPGTYYGQCAELCGMHHAYMPIVVIAVTEDQYKDWVDEQKGVTKGPAEDLTKQWTMKELMERGEQVYTRICAACHQPTGVGMPPTFPALKGSKIATGPLAEHIDRVLNGKAGTAMQAFKDQLSAVELAAVITYERNAFGNDTNTLVQPLDIEALKEGKSVAEVTAAAKEAAKAAPAAAAPQKSATAPAPAAATGAVAAPAAASPAAAQPQKMTKEELMKLGEQTYLSRCAMCHQPTGVGMPPTFPALKGSKIATGPVAEHIDRVLNGKTGTAMQAFKDQLSDEELAAVITYERNAWDNNTNTLVQPADIAAAKKAAP
jgi:cytochrome c oxidase subunit 2